MENAILNNNRSLLLSSLNCKGFKQLLDTQSLVDCTLACDGGKISAHKIVLSACSSYLAKILLEHPVEHPIIILPELSIEEVRTLIHYMYTGELLKSNTLNSTNLLRTAAILSVNSLNDLMSGQHQAHQAAAAAAAAAAAQLQPGAAALLGPPLDQLLATAPAGALFSTRLPLNSAGQHQYNLGLIPATTNNLVSLLSSLHQRTSAAANLNVSSSSSSSLSSASSSSTSSSLSGASAAALADLATGATTAPPASNQQRANSTSANGCATGASLASHQLNFVRNKSASEFQFKCPECQNDFQTICSFEYHMQRIHNITSFGCEICHKPFASLRYVLTDHMRRCHGASKASAPSSQPAASADQPPPAKQPPDC